MRVALTIQFEIPGTDAAGDYRPQAVMDVHVETDGEIVTFTFPDGATAHCDHEPLQAVLR